MLHELKPHCWLGNQGHSYKDDSVRI